MRHDMVFLKDFLESINEGRSSVTPMQVFFALAGVEYIEINSAYEYEEVADMLDAYAACEVDNSRLYLVLDELYQYMHENNV